MIFLMLMVACGGFLLKNKSLMSHGLSLRATSVATEHSVDHLARLRGSEKPRWTSAATLTASTAQKVSDSQAMRIRCTNCSQ